jgi:uncharacterized protein
MHQTWGKLLFLHWAFEPATVRPLVPAGLELDTHDGMAWVGVTPFTMWGVRPEGLPAVPVVSETHELNVRTYVHRDGVPGVWFFSLDAANPLAVVGARVAFHLPYFQASMELREEGNRIEFSSRRRHPGAPDATLEVSWTRRAPLGEAEPDTLEFFLVERYCLYAESDGRLLRSRIHHRPWPLMTASVERLSSTMLEAAGLPTPTEDPLLHAQQEAFEVEVWPLDEV